MAYQSIWYFTNLPEDVVEILDKDLYNNFDHQMQDSKLHGDALNKDKRNSKNTWISTDHWISGFLWHYVQKANRDNFLYDLSYIDGESMQYTRYGEGEYYNWHNDSSIAVHYKPQALGISGGNTVNNEKVHIDYLNKSTELVRKLSFTLQLSDPNDYEGGNVQLMNDAGQSYIAPRKRGTIILFDARTQHRVNKVTKGTRRSIVGWVVGPRWK
jgi:PKHD-type hydroxylase